MKIGLSILLLTLILLPTLSKIWVYIDFKIRQQQITAELCEYRDVPLAMCNGVCYLEDQLQKTELPGQDKVPYSVQKMLDFQLVFQTLSSAGVSDVFPDQYRRAGWIYLACLRGVFPEIILPPPRLS